MSRNYFDAETVVKHYELNVKQETASRVAISRVGCGKILQDPTRSQLNDALTHTNYS